MGERWKVQVEPHEKKERKQPMKGLFFAFVTVAIACGLTARLAAAERRQVYIAAKKVSFCPIVP